MRVYTSFDGLPVPFSALTSFCFTMSFRMGHEPRLFLDVLEARRVPATYFIATDGDNASDGSSAMPWRTTQHAANSVSAGDRSSCGPAPR